MSGWIKLEKDLLTDPRTVRLACAVNSQLAAGNGSPLLGVTVVLGALAYLWMIADTHIGEDDILPLGVDEIDKLLGVPGFTKLMPEDWLVILDANSVKLPGYHEHNGTIAKERALNQKRVERARKKAKTVPRRTITPRNGKALPDQDLDQDLDQEEKRGAARPTPVDYGVVTNLDADAWAIWLAYRRRAKIKTYVDTRMAVRLATYPPEIQRLAVIESITQNYSGLFPEKVKPPTNGATNGAHQGNRRESSYESAGRKLNEWAEQHGLVRDGVGYRAA